MRSEGENGGEEGERKQGCCATLECNKKDSGAGGAQAVVWGVKNTSVA